jgi:hypothetical protein
MTLSAIFIIIFQKYPMNVRDLIVKADLKGLMKALSENSKLANEGILYDEHNPALAHPLHRLCDGVCNGIFSDETACEMAKIFLKFGADVNGGPLIENKDSPLTAAASLRSDGLGALYVHHGAVVNHPGCHGGTPLHWAAWCGRDELLKKLLAHNAHINRLCVDFTATPFFWAIHGFKFGGLGNRHHQFECAKLLLDAGADTTLPNMDGTRPVQLLQEEDRDFKSLFHS